MIEAIKELLTLPINTYKGTVEPMTISGAISTPVCNFIVLTAENNEDDVIMVAFYKLVEPTEEEEDLAVEMWYRMGNGGYPLILWPKSSGGGKRAQQER